MTSIWWREAARRDTKTSEAIFGSDDWGGYVKDSVRTALADERLLSDALSTSLDELLRPAGDLPMDLAGVVRALSDGDDRRRRLLVLAYGAWEPLGAVLSVVFRAVDVVRSSEGTMSMSRYADGRRVRANSVAFTSTQLGLAAADVSLFTEEGVSEYGAIDAVVVAGPTSSFFDGRFILDLIGAPYVLIAEDAIYSFSQMRVLAGASAIYLDSVSLQDEWDSAHIFPASAIQLGDPTAIYQAVQPARRPLSLSISNEHGVNGVRTKSVLLVAYFAPPASAVSVLRLRYWHEWLSDLAGEKGLSMDAWWLSATSGADQYQKSIVIPDRGTLNVPSTEWDDIQELKDLGLDTFGASWSASVKEQMIHNVDPFDTVVISGNPFFYFDLGAFFKDQWGSRVILDFRDPFARNPRFAYTVEQRAKLIALEDQYVNHADAVVSVNRECLDLIAPDVDVMRRIVSNGYNETAFDPSARRLDWSGDRPIRIAYNGTVFANLPIDDLLDSLAPSRYQFLHFGRDYSESQAARFHVVAKAYGLIPYSELITKLQAVDAGVIMTSGESSTQTTKLFDYLACDLDVIIVTQGTKRSGGLHDVTEDLEGIFWIDDDPSALQEFFSSYRPSNVSRSDPERYSRRRQTEQLLDLILELD